MAEVGRFVQASTLADAPGRDLTQKHVNGQFSRFLGQLARADEANRAQALFRP